MYSMEFMKILIGQDTNEKISDKNDVNDTKIENPMYRYSRYATVPIEIKNNPSI